MLRRLASFAPAGAPSLAQDTARMEQVVQSYVANHFMGSVRVARGDKVLFSKGS
jgi:hypothetical protein